MPLEDAMFGKFFFLDEVVKLLGSKFTTHARSRYLVAYHALIQNNWGEPERAPPSHVNGCGRYNWASVSEPPTLMQSMEVACVLACVRTYVLIMRTSGTYSPCDSYACTCAVVIAVHSYEG